MIFSLAVTFSTQLKKNKQQRAKKSFHLNNNFLPPTYFLDSQTEHKKLSKIHKTFPRAWRKSRSEQESYLGYEEAADEGDRGTEDLIGLGIGEFKGS